MIYWKESGTEDIDRDENGSSENESIARVFKDEIMETRIKVSELTRFTRDEMSSPQEQSRQTTLSLARHRM